MEVVMRSRKLGVSVSFVFIGVLICGFAFGNKNPESSEFISYGESSDSAVVRSLTDSDLPWMIYEKPQGPVILDTDFPETERVLGGGVAWPSVVRFGTYENVGEGQSITIQNVAVYSAPDSNMLLNTQDDTIAPTSIQWIKEDGLRGDYTIDLSKEFLIPRGTTLVLAEVVTKDPSMCVPLYSAFLVQFDGYPPVFVIGDSISKPIGSLGKYPLLVARGCKSSAWIFALAPTSTGSISDLYIKYNGQSKYPEKGNWDVVWTGSK